MIGPYLARIGAGVFMVAGLVVACGDDNGTGPEDPGDPGDPIADCLAEANVTGEAVAIRNFTFVPASITVEPGTTVTWVNCENAGTEAHTSTSDTGVWDSPLLSPGEVFTRTFNDEGEFPYHCTPHPTMQGAVIVES